MDIGVHDFQRPLIEWVEQGKTVSSWSDTTILRVAQELLATLRDFGVLEGVAKKKIAPAFFPVESFAYIVFYLKQHQPSGAKLIELPDWKLFFLTPGRRSSGSCLKPTSAACWSTTWLAASPG